MQRTTESFVGKDRLLLVDVPLLVHPERAYMDEFVDIISDPHVPLR